MKNRKDSVKKMYGLFSGRWYDPFQKIWGPKKQVEDTFVSKLRRLSDKDTRILDLGCGTGANFQRLIENHIPFKEYHGIDMTPEMLTIAKKKYPEGNFRISNIENIPGEYDLTISSWFFEHLTQEQRKNILKRKGKHLHMYLGGRKRYNLFLQLFAYFFNFIYVDDSQLKGKKTQYSIATTILEREKKI
ncbi:class I SAM-dependent methyltransferase [Candidatus Woesearchaeota archaeon]|nr:class I SAM-dependent methyltransferase [Candidatus Woesearchaeota archaeon]